MRWSADFCCIQHNCCLFDRLLFLLCSLLASFYPTYIPLLALWRVAAGRGMHQTRNCCFFYLISNPTLLFLPLMLSLPSFFLYSCTAPSGVSDGISGSSTARHEVVLQGRFSTLPQVVNKVFPRGKYFTSLPYCCQKFGLQHLSLGSYPVLQVNFPLECFALKLQIGKSNLCENSKRVESCSLRKVGYAFSHVSYQPLICSHMYVCGPW